MKKIIGTQLYDVYLDLFYADVFTSNVIGDLQVQLKDMRKSSRKIKRDLASAIKRYEGLHGRPPMAPKC